MTSLPFPRASIGVHVFTFGDKPLRRAKNKVSVNIAGFGRGPTFKRDILSLLSPTPVVALILQPNLSGGGTPSLSVPHSKTKHPTTFRCYKVRNNSTTVNTAGTKQIVWTYDMTSLLR